MSRQFDYGPSRWFDESPITMVCSHHGPWGNRRVCYRTEAYRLSFPARLRDEAFGSSSFQARSGASDRRTLGLDESLPKGCHGDSGKRESRDSCGNYGTRNAKAKIGIMPRASQPDLNVAEDHSRRQRACGEDSDQPITEGFVQRQGKAAGAASKTFMPRRTGMAAPVSFSVLLASPSPYGCG